MTSKPSSIQFLSRDNYEKQYLVSFPNAFPLPPLAPSSIRIQTSVISLSANTLMYARIGHILNTWDVHPLPSSASIPPEYADPRKFGRIQTWGYATVLASNVSEIAIGTQVFGYLSIGNLPVDLQVQVSPGIPNEFVEVSKEREKVMSLYNNYVFYPPQASKTRQQKDGQAFDALFQIFFTTSYLINRFVFPWDSADFVYPSAEQDGWTLEKGAIDDETTVLVFADSGKTALALAYLLKNGRPEGSRPKTVLGIGAVHSRAFSQGTGFYDKVLTYDADSEDLNVQLGLGSDSRVILFEFGSRGGAADRWADKLRETNGNVVQLTVAGEVVADSPEKATERFLARTKRNATVFNASKAREQVLSVLGEKTYFQELLRDYWLFKGHGLVKGLSLIWGEGMEDVVKGWEKLCKGEARSDEGMVYSLD